jgi:DNA polymerase V
MGVVMRAAKALKGVSCELPVYMSAVSAGFPSPAEDYVEGKLDLNEHLIPRPSATFMVRAMGDSMTGVGIFSGDILVVDRSLQPKHGSIIIAVIDAELTVKRLYRRKGVIRLEAANPAYPSITVSEDMELWCWGVVTAAIHQYGGANPSASSKPAA